jgi:flagellar hook-associated protein 2
VSSLGLSGLASGVDTSSIVANLMALERQKTTKLAGRQTAIRAEQTLLKNVAAKLLAFKSASEALKKDGDVFKPAQGVESSDPSRVAVSRVSGAGVGGTSIQVDRLASSARRGYSLGDLTAGGTLAVGTTSFTFDPGATTASVVDAINARGDSPVFAAVVKNAAGAERLVLSSRTTGESGRFTISSSFLTEDATYASPPDTLNALFKLNGAATATESQTNVLDDAIPGLRVSLKGVTTSPASIVVSAPDIDRGAVKSKIKAVVDAYNAIVDTTRNAVNEKPVANAATTSDLGKGRLFGDTGMNALLSTLRSSLRETLGGLSGIDDLGDIGIGVPKSSGGASTADAKAGRFTIDDEKLTKALDTDWTKVAKFFDAFAAKVGGLVDAQTGKTASMIDQRVKNEDASIKMVGDQLTRLNARLDAQEKRLKAQFAAMESALQSSQSQQSWLTGQINALNR